MQFLSGDRVYLRPLIRDDIPYIMKWSNDPEIRALTGETDPLSELGADEYFTRINKDQNRVWFIIALKESDRIIGETGLLRMFHPWRTTDLSIIIGEKDAWGKGYGTDAIRLMLDYAFGYLNFHRVSIGVVGFNDKALRFYEKVGFKREGIQRDGYYYNYKYHDFIMMSIMDYEYKSMNREGRMNNE